MDIDKLDREELNFIVNEHVHIEFSCYNCIHTGVCHDCDYRPKNSNLLHQGCASFYPAPEAVKEAVEECLKQDKEFS